MKHTKGEWVCYDLAFSGNRLIENIRGVEVSEVYHERDVNLIKSAPDLLATLEKALKAINKAYDKEPIMLQKLGIDDDLIISLYKAIKEAGQ